LPQPARYRFRTVYPVLLFLLLTAACRNKIAEPAAIAGFNQRIDSIGKLKNDSAKAVAYCTLYQQTEPAVRNHGFTRLDARMASLLLYNPTTAVIVQPQYYAFTVDKTLDEIHRMRACLEMAAFHGFISQNPDSADVYFKMIAKNEAFLDDTLRARASILLAQRHMLRGLRDSAISSFYEAIKISQKLRDSASLMPAYANMANIYRGMGDYKKSVELLRKSNDYLKGNVPKDRRLFIYGGLANDYAELGRYDSARIFFRMTEEMLGTEHRMPTVELQLFLTEGSMYTVLEQFDTAARYFNKATELQNMTQDSVQGLLLTIDGAAAYAHFRNVDNEVAFMKSMIPKFFKLGDFQKAQHTFNSLSMIAAAKGNYQEALRYHNTLDSVKAFISDEKGRKFLQDAETRFETEKKNLTITAQENELRRRRTLNWVLALSAVVALLVAIVFGSRFQLRMSRREARLNQQFTASLLTATEAERGRIATELHDGINHDLLGLKNNLQADQVTLEQQVDGIINSIRLLSRNLHPVMLDKIGLPLSIENLCEQLMSTGRLFVSADISYPTRMKPEAELQLYRIIQESLSNIVKHAEAHAAKITITPGASHLEVTIRDNGKGFVVGEQLRSGRSFGLHSIQERTRALGGKTAISSSTEGTLIHLEIPFDYGHTAHRG
jgi:two-component system NarL family sensor kinase